MQDKLRHLSPKKILIIQTAFLGDVILSTSLIERLKSNFLDARFDFVLRKGNEGVLEDHPLIDKVFCWNKNRRKYLNLLKIIRELRKERYDLVINAQRFASSGLMTFLVKSSFKCGYNKNPFSIFFDFNVEHRIGDGTHETERLLSLIGENKPTNPRLHLSSKVVTSIDALKNDPYIVIAPTSVWYTKQFPQEKWIEFINSTIFRGLVYLVGSSNDFNYCEEIKVACPDREVENLCGKLTILESAALMKDSKMNFVNDSAPMHMCSAVNAPVTVVFCSTVPKFGFGPLSENSKVIELEEELDCRPCGLHGQKRCPKGHFDCANKINVQELFDRV